MAERAPRPQEEPDRRRDAGSGAAPPGAGPRPAEDAARRPAYYAARRPGGWRDWWTLLHPPYTAWHLSYVVTGAALAPELDLGRLAATLAAFFLAVGVSAHALDEWNGRPLRTAIPDAALLGAGGLGLLGAVAIGAAGVTRVGLGLVPFVAVGAFFVVAYDLELFGGRLHTDAGFAAAWGAFPVLTAYYAQAERLSLAAAAGAAFAFALSWAQRALSTPARALRRRVRRVQGSVTCADGTVTAIDERVLLAPLERALRALSWAAVALAAGLLLARL